MFPLKNLARKELRFWNIGEKRLSINICDNHNTIHQYHEVGISSFHDFIYSQLNDE